jgi:hypothetical protein
MVSGGNDDGSIAGKEELRIYPDKTRKIYCDIVTKQNLLDRSAMRFSTTEK